MSPTYVPALVCTCVCFLYLVARALLRQAFGLLVACPHTCSVRSRAAAEAPAHTEMTCTGCCGFDHHAEQHQCAAQWCVVSSMLLQYQAKRDTQHWLHVPAHMVLSCVILYGTADAFGTQPATPHGPRCADLGLVVLFDGCVARDVAVNALQAIHSCCLGHPAGSGCRVVAAMAWPVVLCLGLAGHFVCCAARRQVLCVYIRNYVRGKHAPVRGPNSIWLGAVAQFGVHGACPI